MMQRQHRQPRDVGLCLVTIAVLAAVVLLQRPHAVAAERHVAAGDGHMCVIQAGGLTACYGNPTTANPPPSIAFHAVTAGRDFSCGLTAGNSSLRCWGALPGGTAQLPQPSTFFVDVHARPLHVSGLVPNGTIYCYGDASSRGAINVPPGVVFQGVTSGANYTCGVARNHSVVCWGDVANPVVANTSVWQAITDAEHVAAGVDHACFVRVNGSVACWGSNSRGAAAPPAAVLSSGSVWWLAAGGGMTCATSGSSVPGVSTCWGTVSGGISGTPPQPAISTYEVACAGWGCVASTTGGQLVVAAAAGGLPVPQSVADGNRVVVITLAGNGTSGAANGVGTSARFSTPSGVSLDGAGRLYVADSGNHVIRRVGIASRNVTTVAGVAGSSGTTVSITPLQSKFNNPRGVEADGAGNVYVADTGNNAIRMLSGVWVAGSPTAAAGSAVAAAGTNATFNAPYAVHADVAGGLLYVADYNNMQVRTIAIAGSHAVATLATVAEIINDIALNIATRVMYAAVDDAVFVVTNAAVPTRLAGSTTAAGSYLDATGNAARFNNIYGLALDAGAGFLYVADCSNHRIRRITTSGGVVSTLAGSGSATLLDGIGTSAAFNSLRGIALDVVSGTLYIGDSGNHAIRLVRFPLPDSITLAPVPLPPSPLAPTHQLTAWRALGTVSSTGDPSPVLDARGATFALPLAAASTAGLNTAIRTLLLGAVTLAPRNATPAAAGNTNTSFSTSAQRGLQTLALAAPVVPMAALAHPTLTKLALNSPAPTQQLRLSAGSFDGLNVLTCLNCRGVAGVANLSGLLIGALLTQPVILPLITAFDATTTGIDGVYANSFDGMPSLRWLSLAGNINLTFVSDAAFSTTKQPALANIDESRTPLTTGSGCRAGSSNRIILIPVGGAPYVACSTCPSGTYCTGGASNPNECGANTYATGGAATCLQCPAGTYAMDAAKECIACPLGLVAPGCNATASWRDSITLVADGAGSWVNARIYLAPAGALPGTANVSCGLVVVVSTNAVSCALPFLLPAAIAAPVLTNVWVAHAGTGGLALQLNTTIMLLPPPQVVVAPGGSVGLVPLIPGGGRIVLRLPAPRLTAADWTAVGLQPPLQATVDGVAVWLGGAPCTQPAWESSTTLTCAIPAADGVDILVVVLLAGLFNVTGVLPAVFMPPALLMAASTDLTLLPPAATVVNITLAGASLCVGQLPRLSVAYVGGLRCATVGCIAGRSDAAICIGWNTTTAVAAGLLQHNRSTVQLNASAVWANRAAPLVTCGACISLATRPVLASITPSSIAAPGVPVVVAGTGLMDASRVLPTVFIGGVKCIGTVVLTPAVVQCNAPTVPASALGYPVVSVVVINAVGAASTEPVNLTYPATFAVSWASTPTLAALPGGLLVPAPMLVVLSRQAATCALTINVSSCATSNPALVSRPAGMAVSTPATALAVGASGTFDAVQNDLFLDALEASGASGCTGMLMASCIDDVGLAASTAGLANPTVALAGWRADWVASSVPNPFIVVPGALSQLAAVFILSGSDGMLTTATMSSLTCIALLVCHAATTDAVAGTCVFARRAVIG